jgi:hypothetical protein
VHAAQQLGSIACEEVQPEAFLEEGGFCEVPAFGAPSGIKGMLSSWQSLQGNVRQVAQGLQRMDEGAAEVGWAG